MNSEKTLLVAGVLSMVIAVCLGLRAQAHGQETPAAWPQPLNTNGALVFSGEPCDHTILVLHLGYKGKMIVTVYSDGRVEFGEGFAADTAARQFWRILGRVWVSDQCLPITVHDAPKTKCAPGYTLAMEWRNGVDVKNGYVCETLQ